MRLLRLFSIALVLGLVACGGPDAGKRPEISRARAEPASGITYDQFRTHSMNADGDYLAAQKRFMALDRNNDGRLSKAEIGGY